jgi:effector-binding domain-containing protein
MAYDISRHEVPDQPIVSIRDCVAQATLPAFIGHAFGQLFGHLRVLGVAPGGEPFVIYHEFGPSEVDAEVCVPIAGGVVANGTISARVLPGATVARTLHVGPYEELADAYAALTHWIGAHDVAVVGPVRERYLNAPGGDVGPSDYRTIIEIPIVEAAVLVA